MCKSLALRLTTVCSSLSIRIVPIGIIPRAETSARDAASSVWSEDRMSRRIRIAESLPGDTHRMRACRPSPRPTYCVTSSSPRDLHASSISRPLSLMQLERSAISGSCND